MLVPTIKRDFSLGLSHFHLALQKSSVCCVPTTLLKNHNQRSVAGWTTTAWLAVIKERLPKDTHDVKINNNFTSLPTYDYSPSQAQPIMSLLINLRDGSVLVTKHPDLTIWTHFLSTTEPHTSHERLQQQPELKALAHLPQPPPKHPSSAFRAASLPARLSSKVPSCRKQILSCTGHLWSSPLTCTCLSPRFTMSLSGCRFWCLHVQFNVTLPVIEDSGHITNV